MRNVWFLLIFSLILVGCGTTPESPPPPPPTLTPVATSTPLPPIDTGAYDDIPASITEDGFPTLGQPDAPITLTMLGSYDSNATQNAHTDIIADLLPRIEVGEMQLVYVPLSGTGTANNGRGAALAALCAGDQGAFWPYHDRLFALYRANGDDAYSNDNLAAITDTLGLNRENWVACLTDERPAPILDRATAAASDNENYAGTPTLLMNGNYVLNDRYSINTIADQMLQRVNDSGEITPLTDDFFGNDTTDDTETLVLPPVANQTVGTPIELALMDGWQIVINDTLLVPDIDAIRTVPFVMYRGPVAGGTGTIALLWGFPSIVSGNMIEAQMGIATPTPNLWTDGLRLLRLAVIENGCTVGTDIERQYTVGGQTGTGTQWSAVNCPELPDTRGWFVGVEQFGLSYLFYAYVEPIDPNGLTESEQQAREQIQAMLDSVQFRSPDDMATDSER